MNFMSVRSMYFLGRGLGAGDSTVSDLLSMSTPVLWWGGGRERGGDAPPGNGMQL